MIIKDFVFRAESEGGDHPERARKSSVDLTSIQMPVSGDLRPAGTRIPFGQRMGRESRHSKPTLPILHKTGRDL